MVVQKYAYERFFKQVIFSCILFFILILFACFNVYNIQKVTQYQKASNDIQNAVDSIYENIQKAHLIFYDSLTKKNEFAKQRYETLEEEIHSDLKILDGFENLKKISGHDITSFGEVIDSDFLELKKSEGPNFKKELIILPLSENIQRIEFIGNKLNQAEELQLVAQEASLKSYSLYSIIGIIAAGALGVITLSLSGFSMRRSLHRMQDAEKKMREAQAQAETANKMKTQFLAVMSHELRTPLHGILGLTDVLHQQVRSDLRQYTSLVRGAGDSLLKLVNNFLQITKIENGQMSLDLKEFSPRETADRCFQILKAQAISKKININLEMSSNLPNRVIADEQKIYQILLNLITNAIRYTDHGQILISVTASVGSSQRQNLLKFEVKDTGIGISEEDQEHIFQGFYRSENSKGRDGVGIGLSLCASLANFLGGKISFSSQNGIGSTFWFSVPVQIRSEVDLAIDPPLNQGLEFGVSNEFKVNRILIVEDNDTNQILIENHLNSLGIKFDLCQTGEDAIKNESVEKYDLILLDCQLPGLSGYEVVASWRKKLGPKLPKVIAMTAHAMPEEKAYCLSIGFDDLLTKPFGRLDLLHILEKHCAHNEEGFTSVNPLAELDEESFQKLKDSMILNLGKALEKMTQALLEKDSKTIYYWSHTVKPSIKLFEATHLFEICQAIELKSQNSEINWDQLKENINDFTMQSESLIRELSL